MRASSLFFSGFMIMAACYFAVQYSEGDMFHDDGVERGILDWAISGGMLVTGYVISHFTRKFIDNRYILINRRVKVGDSFG